MTVQQPPAWVFEYRDRLPTPCYVYEETMLAESLRRLRTCLPEGARVFYSLKANPQPQVASIFNQLGAWPEVASEGEYNICLAAGISSAHILVGGVAKSRNFLARICREGCHATTIDSAAELARLVDVPPGDGAVRFLLRVNPGIAIGGLDMGGDSQFGIGVDDAIALVMRGEFGQHTFAGIHCYFGSQRLRAEPILKTVQIVAGILRQFRDAGCEIPRVDVGLGCGVPYLARDVDLDTDALADGLSELWADPVWSGVELWSEAGRFLVGQSGTFVTRVLERKRLNGRDFVLLDGGLNAHNPGLGLGRVIKSNPRFLFAPLVPGALAASVEMCGSLCTSADKLGTDVNAPALVAGDLVVIPNSGAYCHTTALWGFNTHAPFHEAVLSTDGLLRLITPQHEAFRTGASV